MSTHRRGCVATFVLAVAWVAAAPTATADEYEATIGVRPLGVVGRFTEHVALRGGDQDASVYGGGLAVSASYGVRNWLDVGAELAVAGFQEASYDNAVVLLGGAPTMGRLTRTSQLAALRVGGTLRLGVAWVPTLYVGLGLNTRLAGSGELHSDLRMLPQAPDGLEAKVQFDLATVARLGLERRLDRRWTVGMSVEAMRTMGLGSSSIVGFSAALSGAYSWYPNWW